MSWQSWIFSIHYSNHVILQKSFYYADLVCKMVNGTKEQDLFEIEICFNNAKVFAVTFDNFIWFYRKYNATWVMSFWVTMQTNHQTDWFRWTRIFLAF